MSSSSKRRKRRKQADAFLRTPSPVHRSSSHCPLVPAEEPLVASSACSHPIDEPSSDNDDDGLYLDVDQHGNEEDDEDSEENDGLVVHDGIASPLVTIIIQKQKQEATSTSFFHHVLLIETTQTKETSRCFYCWRG